MIISNLREVEGIKFNIDFLNNFLYIHTLHFFEGYGGLDLLYLTSVLG